MKTDILSQEVRRLKGRLTRVVKSGNNDNIIVECRYAYTVFDRVGWPDCWANWQRAEDDARVNINRNKKWSIF